MTRPRDRLSNLGLLPRMEAIPRKNGFTYRYHPVNAKPINLGHDLQKALRAVIDLNCTRSEKGSLKELWQIYIASEEWSDLSQGSKDDYTQSSKKLLTVFGNMMPREIRPMHINRYLRVERSDASVRANREFALLSNLMAFACSRGELEVNPCQQVKRNKETPRKKAPSVDTLSQFLKWAWSKTGQAPILAAMAEFASITGNRGAEFRELSWQQVYGDELRLQRAKQRNGNEVVEMIQISQALKDLLNRLRKLAKNDREGWVFPNSEGNAYTAQAFKLGFARLKKAARVAGALEVDFTFHDLRSYFVTQYKAKHKTLPPDLHSDPGTTARIYDSSKVIKRKSL